MSRTKRIDSILKKNLADFTVNIVDNSNQHIGHNNFNGNDETHISIQLKCIVRTRINRLEIHKYINSLLKEEYNKGLHSLEIKIISND